MSNYELREMINFLQTRREQILELRERQIDQVNKETLEKLDDIDVQIEQYEDEVVINSIVQHCLTGK
jgi:hypothetical protein